MKGELYIKERRCKGCGICAAFCPKQVLEVSLLGKITPVRPDDCIACGQCARILRYSWSGGKINEDRKNECPTDAGQ